MSTYSAEFSTTSIFNLFKKNNCNLKDPSAFRLKIDVPHKDNKKLALFINVISIKNTLVTIASFQRYLSSRIPHVEDTHCTYFPIGP